MSSWFNVDSIAKGIADAAANVNVDSIKEISGKVKSAVPTIDKGMLEKLTLTTPELREERQRIDAEERRKEQRRDMLAGLLPWETRDPERDILVEECKDAVLNLSADKSTFFGPYSVPRRGVDLEKDKDKDNDGGDVGSDDEVLVNDDDVDGNDDDDNAAAGAGAGSGMDDEAPSKESLEKLAKLEPLPPLLRDFDLNSHVGLIQRLLKEDPKLVEQQSKLSGGGEREISFWRNYFFHCAYTRYEAGLSIDEIWSDEPAVHEMAAQQAAAAAVTAAGTSSTKAASAAAVEEEISFEHAGAGGDDTVAMESPSTSSAAVDKSVDGGAAAADASKKDKAVGGKEAAGGSTTGGGAAGASVDLNDSNSSGYEMVGANVEGDGTAAAAAAVGVGDDENADDGDAVDYELDELEAEIARELED